MLNILTLNFCRLSIKFILLKKCEKMILNFSSLSDILKRITLIRNKTIQNTYIEFIFLRSNCLNALFSFYLFILLFYNHFWHKLIINSHI